MRKGRAVAAGAVALAGLALAAAPPALAHGLVGRQDLPIPRWLFWWGASVVLVVSFVALAVLWPRPRLQEPRERRLAGVGRVLDVLAGGVGIGLFGIVVYAGLAGTQAAVDNLAPTAIYVAFWVGIPVSSLFLGDVFRAFNPWRALARGAGWLARRAGGEGMPEPLAYPQRLGRWPAALGVLAFVWVELIWTEGDDPSTLAILALAYAAVQLVGMSLYGVEPWTTRGDAFSVYFGLFARLAPLRWRDGAVFRRPPLGGAPSLTPVPGTVALLAVAIGTTSFDGFSQGTTWSSMVPDLQTFFVDAGLNQRDALEAGFSVGLLGMVLGVALLYHLGVLGMRTVARDRTAGELARAFAHSLVPIALAYVIAHYFSLLVYQGQALAHLASDPLGDGSDIFGTASSTIDYAVISANDVWYVQVGALVVGHVAALVLAHDRAVALFGSGRDATRSQYWMLAVMVGFTFLGLWLLSAAAQG